MGGHSPLPNGAPASGATDLPAPGAVVEQLLELRRVAEAAGQPMSLTEMAAGIGVHAGTLLRVLKDRQLRPRRLPSDDFCRRAWSWLTLREMQAEDRQVGSVVETTVTRRVAKLCAYCQVERVMGMIVSETSAGKTTALRAYAAANPAAIYLHATHRNNSPTGLIDQIWARAGFRQSGTSYRHRKTFSEKWDSIVGAFRTAGVTARVLLVDDAHTLSFSALETLREIHDETDIGVVLAGVTRLEERVTLAGDAHQLYEQLRARVQIVRVIGRPTAADVAAVAAAWAPAGTRFDADAAAYLVELSAGLGALRLVKAHVRAAFHLGGALKLEAGQTVDRRHLAAAHTQLQRQRSALAGKEA